MQFIRRHTRLAALIAILALVGSLVSGPFAPKKAAVSLVDDVLGLLVLCTSHGSQTLTQDGGNSVPEPASAHCWMCTLLAALTLVTGILLLLPLALGLPRVRRFFSSGVRTLADHLCLGGIRSRAPPLFA
jgi:Protein of unknown function (DUF2946)